MKKYRTDKTSAERNTTRAFYNIVISDTQHGVTCELRPTKRYDALFSWMSSTQGVSRFRNPILNNAKDEIPDFDANFNEC